MLLSAFSSLSITAYLRDWLFSTLFPLCCKTPPIREIKRTHSLRWVLIKYFQFPSASISTLLFGRLLCSHRACPSYTLYGILSFYRKKIYQFHRNMPLYKDSSEQLSFYRNWERLHLKGGHPYGIFLKSYLKFCLYYHFI